MRHHSDKTEVACTWLVRWSSLIDKKSLTSVPHLGGYLIQTSAHPMLRRSHPRDTDDAGRSLPGRVPVAVLGLQRHAFIIIITRFSCLRARCVCRQAALKAAKILPHVGLELARSKQDPINRGHGAHGQYLYRPPPAGANRHALPLYKLLFGSTLALPCVKSITSPTRCMESKLSYMHAGGH